MTSFFLFLFSLNVAFCSCRPETTHSGFRRGRSDYSVARIGQLPAVVNESSGLLYRPGRGTFWTHNDSGGRPTLYEVRPDGTLVDSLPLPHLRNVDWEALAGQDSTTLFVGDIGNNGNARRQLIVYRINRLNPDQTDRITFHYARQTQFPAPKDTRNFDSEALVYQPGRPEGASTGQLFLISKNRSEPRRPVLLYRLPAQPGEYALTPVDSIFLKSMVTDATLSPDGQTLAVLTYGKIFLFATPGGQVSFRQPLHCLRIPRGQTEGLAFVNNTDLVMTNEGGKIYRITKKRSR